MQRVLSYLVTLALLCAPCAATELVISVGGGAAIAKDSVASVALGTDHDCPGHAKPDSSTGDPYPCGSDCHKWLTGKSQSLDAPRLIPVAPGLVSATLLSRGAVHLEPVRQRGPLSWRSATSGDATFILASTNRLRL